MDSLLTSWTRFGEGESRSAVHGKKLFGHRQMLLSEIAPFLKQS